MLLSAFKKRFKNQYPELESAIKTLGPDFFKTLASPDEPFLVVKGIYSKKYLPHIFIWCEKCQYWHTHGLGTEEYISNTLTHRSAHCHDKTSNYPHGSYFIQGFNIDLLK